MNEQKVSIIVPVYNSIKFLDKCIHSILNQTYTNIELVLVDDGSNDGSERLCDDWKCVDSRVKVIHKSNEGTCIARKTGMMNSTGSYIFFVDSDDWIECITIEMAMKYQKKYDADIVQVDYIREYDDGKLPICIKDIDSGLYDLTEECCWLWNNFFSVSGVLWGKLYRRDIIFDMQMSVDDRITIGEDAAVFFPSLLQAKRYCVVNHYLYHYLYHMGSITRTRDFNFCDINILYDYLYNVVDKSQHRKELMYSLKHLMIHFIEYIQSVHLGINEDILYLMPYEIIDKGAKIVLYGAGKVGHAYKYQLEVTNHCKFVGWINSVTNGEKDVSEIRLIENIQYDNILIGVENELTADEIINQLVNVYGVDRNKILWAAPKKIKEYRKKNIVQ